jgi:hypothetical protein
MKCPKCGFENRPDARACGQCGLDIERQIGDQLVVGDYILQIGSGHGGVVKVSTPAQGPLLQPRPTPIFLRSPDFPGLLDREAEISTATAAIRSATQVAFRGQPGVGKTALLCHLSHHPVATSFPDGVVHLAAHRQPVEDVLQFLFDTFYESDVPFKPTDVQVRQALHGKQALVILDDADLAWHDVQVLMDVAPGCTFVLASAERRPWRGGQAIDLGGLPPGDALALLERALERPLTPEERPVAQALCTTLEGHPLHVLQAAALVREGDRSLAEVARRALSGSPAEALTAQALAVLGEAEKRVLGVLAAVGDVPFHADHLSALAELPDVAPILETLQRRGLVQAHSPRYSLAGMLGQALRQTWDVIPWAERALAYFAAWAERQRQAPGRLLEEADVILRVLGWAVGADRWVGVVRLGRAAADALALGGRWSAWAQVLQWVHQAAEALGDRTGKAWALHQLGTRALCLGDAAVARTALIQALRLRETLGDQVGTSVTRDNLDLLVGPPAPPSPPSPPWRSSRPPAARPLVRPAVSGVSPVVVGCAVLLIVLLVTVVGLGARQLWPRYAPPTPMPTPTSTSTPTATPTNTPTATPTPTATSTNTPMPTATPTDTPTPTQTSTPTNTPTPTSTPTNTPTPTETPTPTPTPDRVGPPAPQPLAPVPGAELFCPPGGANLGVQLQWVNVSDPSGIRTYEIHLEAIERVPRTYPLQFSSGSFLDVFVPCGEVYRWWVRAVDGAGNAGAWSPARIFTVRDTTGPPAPAPVEPEDGAEIPCPIDPTFVTFRWSEVEDPSGIAGYSVQLEVAVDGTPTPPAPTPAHSGPVSGTKLATSLACGWDYRWRVQAVDGVQNPGAWSAWSAFRLSAPTP